MVFVAINKSYYMTAAPVSIIVCYGKRHELVWAYVVYGRLSCIFYLNKTD